MDRRTHKNAKHAHARQRANEHFGISLTKDRISNIIKQIETGKAIALDHDWDGRSTYIVTVDGQKVKIIFSRMDKTIITVMPVKPEDEFDS